MTKHQIPAANVDPQNRDVVGNSDLTLEERETVIRFDGESNTATVYSEVKTNVRSLVHHSEFDPDWYHLTDEGDIWATHGEVPIGLLKIKKCSRSSDGLSFVVSDQDDVDQSGFNE